MTRNTILHLFAVMLTAVACTTEHAPLTLAERIDYVLSDRLTDDADNEPGFAIIIARGDSILYERYAGVADMVTGEAITDSTLFNIASVSKQFTVAALLQTGVDVNDKADRYFDYPQSFWHDISLADLAGHTSGIPDSRDRSCRDSCVYATDATSMKYFATVDTLRFVPGTAYDYLNPSFLLLARVVEQQSGQEFCQYQHEHLFQPLGMDMTVYFDPDTMPQHTAHGYVADERGRWQEYDYGEETFFATRPDGGIYSTARDMLRWERGLASGLVISDSLLRLAYTPRISVSDSPWCDYQRRPYTWYGLGWFVDTTPGRPVKVYHTGDNGGFQAYVAKYPDQDISIILLENRHDQDRWQTATAIDDVLANYLDW